MFLDKFVVSQMRFIEWMKFKIFFYQNLDVFHFL
jgi:hypothetical protein